MAKIILFDIDDTLFPSSEFSEQARRNALRAMIGMGIDRSEDELYAMLLRIIKSKGSNYPRHFDEVCRSLKIKKPARFVGAAVAAYHQTKASIAAFPGVQKMLLSLRDSGHRLYVASNGKAIKQWDKLIRLGIALFFDDVFVSAEIGKEKGVPFFRNVLKELNAAPEDCIMIGDREDADIAPAKKIGMATIKVRQGKYAKEKTSADFSVDLPAQVISIVSSLKSS